MYMNHLINLRTNKWNATSRQHDDIDINKGLTTRSGDAARTDGVASVGNPTTMNDRPWCQEQGKITMDGTTQPTFHGTGTTERTSCIKIRA